MCDSEGDVAQYLGSMLSQCEDGSQSHRRAGPDRITGRLHYTHHSQFLTVSPLTVPQTLDPFCAVLCAHIMQYTSHDSNII